MPAQPRRSANGDVLYNGIELPSPWPPSGLDPHATKPPALPYLEAPSSAIPIDVGRQLFVDEFLIEQTTLRRTTHRPRKHTGNPLLRPETALELNGGHAPVACPFSDGVFYDPADRLFKMWYMAGWFDGTALAISQDGIHWERPAFDVVPGTNRVLAPREDFRRDGTGVWLDHDAVDPNERFKMLLFARSATHGSGGHLLASPDGVHWEWRVRGGRTGRYRRQQHAVLQSFPAALGAQRPAQPSPAGAGALLPRARQLLAAWPVAG